MEHVKEEESQKKGGIRSLFDDLSIAQLAAGALAAATSMVLASNIGIAGTVIGVSVGSVVSAVASQLYKKFLSASAEKIRDLAPIGPSPESVDAASSQQDASKAYHGRLSGSASGEGARNRNGSSQGELRSMDTAALPVAASTEALPSTVASSASPQVSPAALTQLLGDDASTVPSAAGETAPLAVGATLGADESKLGEGSVVSNAYADAALLRSRASRERKRKIQRNAVVVAVVSAIVAVGICAAIIGVATQGKGLGPQMPAITPWANYDAASSAQGSSSGGGYDAPSQDSSASESGDAASGEGSSDATENTDGSDSSETKPGDSGSSSDGGGSGAGSGSDSSGSSGSDAGSGAGSDSGSGSGGDTGSGSGPDAGSGSTDGSENSGSGAGGVSVPNASAGSSVDGAVGAGSAAFSQTLGSRPCLN